MHCMWCHTLHKAWFKVLYFPLGSKSISRSSIRKVKQLIHCWFTNLPIQRKCSKSIYEPCGSMQVRKCNKNGTFTSWICIKGEKYIQIPQHMFIMSKFKHKSASNFWIGILPPPLLENAKSKAKISEQCLEQFKENFSGWLPLV